MRIRHIKATRTHLWLLVPREIQWRGDCFLARTELILPKDDDDYR